MWETKVLNEIVLGTNRKFAIITGLARRKFRAAELRQPSGDHLLLGASRHQRKGCSHSPRKCQVIRSEQALEPIRRALGRFILATNALDPAQLSPEMMLSQYKAQAVSVERGFRFLKDPLFFADSLFLKNPGRIMALIMIMVLALLVYSLAERKLRLQLAKTGQQVPNQVGKQTQTPTMRWAFQVFEGIDLLIVSQNGRVISCQALNLKQARLTVLRLLGPPVEKCYHLGF